MEIVSWALRNASPRIQNTLLEIALSWLNSVIPRMILRFPDWSPKHSISLEWRRNKRPFSKLSESFPEIPGSPEWTLYVWQREVVKRERCSIKLDTKNQILPFVSSDRLHFLQGPINYMWRKTFRSFWNIRLSKLFFFFWDASMMGIDLCQPSGYIDHSGEINLFCTIRMRLRIFSNIRRWNVNTLWIEATWMSFNNVTGWEAMCIGLKWASICTTFRKIVVASRKYCLSERLCHKYVRKRRNNITLSKSNDTAVWIVVFSHSFSCLIRASATSSMRKVITRLGNDRTIRVAEVQRSIGLCSFATQRIRRHITMEKRIWAI